MTKSATVALPPDSVIDGFSDEIDAAGT